MSQLASFASLAGAGASLAGTGANIYGQVRQGEIAQNTYGAERQLLQDQAAARAQALQAAYNADTQARNTQLASAIADNTAKLAASGVQPGDGSAAAVTSGIMQRTALAQDSANAAFNSQLAAQPRSLLAPDNSFNNFLNAGQSFGAAVQSLI